MFTRIIIIIYCSISLTHHCLAQTDRSSSASSVSPLSQLSSSSSSGQSSASIASALSSSSKLSSAIVNSFHIRVNTIIRTQDSRNLGAKYLNESEFKTSEDCFNWCLIQSPCNLAVYEERGQGSCYLFDCGPTEDFRCKFTSHNYYTSAILKLSRYSVDTNQWGNQLKHEKELVKLRQLMNDKANVTLTTQKTSEPFLVLPTRASINEQSIKKNPCQHYQFQCRNSSECIAIYNVCDGIPQCPDKSDEAPDLHCPDQNAFIFNEKSKPKAVTGADETLPIEAKKPQHVYLKPLRITQDNQVDTSSGNNANLNNVNNDFIPSGQQYMVKGQNYPPAIPSPNQSMRQYYQQFQQLLPEQKHLQQQIAANNFYPNQYPSENEYSTYNRDVPVLNYWTLDNDQNNYDRQISEQNINKPSSKSWSNFANNVSPVSDVGRGSNYYNYILQREMENHDNKPQANSQSNLNENLRSDNVKATVAQNLAAQKKGNPKKSSAIETVNKEKNKKIITEPVAINGKIKEVNKPSYQPKDGVRTIKTGKVYETIAITHLHDSSVNHGRDTNGAVIALVLGLCITGMLIGIVGFRMKSIKRKIARRGGRNLSHDADYLVNGMYL